MAPSARGRPSIAQWAASWWRSVGDKRVLGFSRAHLRARRCLCLERYGKYVAGQVSVGKTLTVSKQKVLHEKMLELAAADGAAPTKAKVWARAKKDKHTRRLLSCLLPPCLKSAAPCFAEALCLLFVRVVVRLSTTSSVGDCTFLFLSRLPRNSKRF